MYLKSFTPLRPPPGNLWGTKTYYFPIVDFASVKITAELDTEGAALQEVSDGMGSYLSSGTYPEWIGSGKISCTLHMTSNWLASSGYSGNAAGLAQALFDFDQAIMQSGLGTVVDLFPSPGIMVNGNTITQRTCQAIVTDETTLAPQGPDYAQIQLILVAPSGTWLLSDGVTTQTFIS